MNDQRRDPSDRRPEGWETITSRLDRALIDADQLPLLVMRLRKDMNDAKARIEIIEPEVQSLKNAEPKRFTRKQAEDLFVELFKEDLQERNALARLVKLIYIPLGLLAAGTLIEGIVQLVKK